MSFCFQQDGTSAKHSDKAMTERQQQKAAGQNSGTSNTHKQSADKQKKVRVSTEPATPFNSPAKATGTPRN